jgi:hypothetical protein
MSRLIDKLTKIRRTEPQPMGFAIGKPAVEKPRMQLVASLTPRSLEKLAGDLSSADAMIIQVMKVDDAEAIDKACQAKDSAPAGGWLQAFDDATLTKLTDTACDFVVFPSDSPLISLKKDNMGRVLQIDTSLTDGLLRATNDLPVDAVLAASPEKECPLTFNHIMHIQRLVYLINKPILVEIPIDLTGVELQALWDTGISGVVMEVTDKKSADKFAELRETVGKLTPTAFIKRARMSPVLPHVQAETPPPRQDEEEEEEDE